MEEFRKIFNNFQLGDVIPYEKLDFKHSQAVPKVGSYTLEKIDLSKIDVVIKGIDNRSFFYWDDDIDNHIEGIKSELFNLPPVILEKYGDIYYSVDGHHRITAAKELGLTNILALTIKTDKLSYPRR